MLQSLEVSDIHYLERMTRKSVRECAHVCVTIMLKGNEAICVMLKEVRGNMADIEERKENGRHDILVKAYF